jgi:hypothetical protein
MTQIFFPKKYHQRPGGFGFAEVSIWGQSESAPTSTQGRMDDKWSRNNFMLGSIP